MPAVEGALADEQAVRVALQVVELALFVFDLEQLAFVVVAEGDLVAVGVDALAQLVQPAPAELGDGAGGQQEAQRDEKPTQQRRRSFCELLHVVVGEPWSAQELNPQRRKIA